MKKRILSIALVLCMVLTLLPVSALAADYDGWAAAMADGVTLTADTDTVTIDGVAYTYKGDGGGGIEMYTGNTNTGVTALAENCCWKAGDGYVLYKPTVESGAVVTLHNAVISTTDTDALRLPYNSSFAESYAVPATVNVEGANHLTTTGNSALYHKAGDTTFTGGGTLSITGNIYNFSSVTIESGTNVTVGGGSTNSQIAGNLTVTGSGSKLTIADGTNLAIGVWGGTPTATVAVENGGVLENNGTLTMAERVDPDNSHIVGEISGSGGIMLYNKTYTLVDGVFYPYGADVETSGLNLSGKNNDGTDNSAYNAPTIQTCYRAGSGYIIFTPATTDPEAKAKLELYDTSIVTTSGRALYLPAEPVDITVTGNNSLSANGSYNYAIDTNEQAVNITGGGNLSLTGNKGIASWNGSTPSVAINIGGNLVISTNQTYSISGNGNIDLSAASITTGIITAGNGSLTATAKTGNLTIDNGTSNSTAVVANDITLNAPNGAISVAGAGNNLLQSSGMVTLNAKGNIAFTSSNTSSIPIYFGTGVSMTSDAGSIDVTTSGYSGIEKTNGSTGGGGVTLSAAKDITLNVDYTAISTSAEDVYLTAGGKLTSTSKYGFQTGALAIKANEVSIEGTAQDGIYATSVSITNPTGGNCKSVSVTATNSSDYYAAIRALGSADTGNITVKADDVFICGKGGAKAISALGTVTINGAGMIAGTIAAGTDSIDSRIICAANGGDKSGGLDLSTPPTEVTVYTAGSGYALFTPATTTPAAPAKLTLHNATIHNTTAINDETGTGIALPDGAITLVVEGTNTIGAQYANAIWGSNADVTLSGSGILDVGYKAISLKSTAANPHSFTKGANVTLNGMVKMYDNSDESGDKNTNTVYGSVTVPADSQCILGGTITVVNGAVLTIPQGSTLDLVDAKAITNNGTLLNNGTLKLPQSYNTEAAVKAMKLTGTGVVKAGSQSYTNGGTAVTMISGGLDLSTGDHSGKTLESDGYTWDADSKTLTLKNLMVRVTDDVAVTVPDNTIVVLEGDNLITSRDAAAISGVGALTVQGSGTLDASGTDGGLYAKQITITGSAKVTVNGIDNGDENESSVTVSGSAVFTSSKYIRTKSYAQSGSTDVAVNEESMHGIITLGELRVDGGSLTVTSEVAALMSGGGITLGSGMAILAPSGGKIASAELTVNNVTRTIVSVIPAGETALTAELVGATISSNGAKNVVIGTAPVTPSYDGGGSSSGNTVNVPVSGSTGTANVSASVSGGTAMVSASDAQLKEIASGSETSGTVKIDLSALKADTAVIPTKLVSAASSTPGLSGLEVALSTGTVTLDKSALEAVSGKGDIKLSVETVDNSKLTEAQKSALGSQASTALVVDVNLYAGGTQTSTFGDGTISVSVPYTPKSGENTDSITVWFIKDDGTIEPKTAVYSNGKVTFTTEHLSQYLIVSFPFVDVAEDEWYYGSVAYAYNNGLFAGATADKFEPEAAMTREMIWMVLARMDGKTPSDMNAARLWAMENGISDGSDSTSSITREQMATILYRYAEYKKYDTTQGGMAIREFTDYASISEYALPALGWTVRTGLIKGSDNNVMPSCNATRAEVAIILQRFSQNVAK